MCFIWPPSLSLRLSLRSGDAKYSSLVHTRKGRRLGRRRHTLGLVLPSRTGPGLALVCGPGWAGVISISPKMRRCRFEQAVLTTLVTLLGTRAHGMLCVPQIVPPNSAKHSFHNPIVPTPAHNRCLSSREDWRVSRLKEEKKTQF